MDNDVEMTEDELRQIQETAAQYQCYVDTARALDIRLLNYMNIGTIIDLMVENKKVKYGF